MDDTRYSINQRLKIKSNVLNLISDDNYIAACEIIVLYPISFAIEILDELETEEKISLFQTLPIEISSLVFHDLSAYSQHEILKEIKDDLLIELIINMETDDAVDLMGLVSWEHIQKIIGKIPQNILELYSHDEDSAGGIMESDYLSFYENLKVEMALLRIGKMTKNIDHVYHIFLVDNAKRLTGIMPIQRLFVSDKKKTLKEISDPPHMKIYVDQDQEEVAQFFRKNDLISAPVVDSDNHLVGKITIDDIVDVVDEEATEDSYRMVGMNGDDYTPTMFLQVKSRLPWLVISLVAEIISGTVLRYFGDTLSTIIILSSFIPLIMAMGGNVGVQSATVVIRTIALGELVGTNRKRIITRELFASMILGLIFGISLVVVGYVWGNIRVGFVAGFSIMAAMMISTSVGCFFPLILKGFGKDPAFATGPFITAFNDVFGLLIYLLIATHILINLA